MSNPLESILLFATRIANQNLTSKIVCPECGERHRINKWGFYTRYLFHGDDSIYIQRFRCLNQECPRFTFSILPHPLLPVVRLPLCFFLMLLSMNQEGCSIADLARKSGRNWSVIRRALKLAKRLQSFLQNEVKTILRMSSPCLQPAAVWTVFTHAFSWALFPSRF